MKRCERDYYNYDVRAFNLLEQHTDETRSRGPRDVNQTCDQRRWCTGLQVQQQEHDQDPQELLQQKVLQ